MMSRAPLVSFFLAAAHPHTHTQKKNAAPTRPPVATHLSDTQEPSQPHKPMASTTVSAVRQGRLRAGARACAAAATDAAAAAWGRATGLYQAILSISMAALRECVRAGGGSPDAHASLGAAWPPPALQLDVFATSLHRAGIDFPSPHDLNSQAATLGSPVGAAYGCLCAVIDGLRADAGVRGPVSRAQVEKVIALRGTQWHVDPAPGRWQAAVGVTLDDWARLVDRADVEAAGAEEEVRGWGDVVPLPGGGG